MSGGGSPAAACEPRRVGWSALRKPAGGARRAAAEDHWFEVPGELVSQYGVLWLRAAPGADLSELLESLRQGTYRRPFVLDDGVTRRLHFDFNSIQSEMTIGDPLELNFAYTRRMMAFLLFHPRPEHVVVVGLGGGSMTRFCHRQLPETRVTTVEIDEDVIAMSDFFGFPGGDGRSQLVHADAAEYFATTDDMADVVLIDGCDRWGTATTFCDADFYVKLRARLRPGGLMVLNLIGRDHRKTAAVAGVTRAFGGRHIAMSVPEGGNHLLFAFNEGCVAPDWQALRQQAETLEDAHRLNFPAFARRLQRNCSIEGWR
ncbi:spermidine synthase [Solimonas fluminis]|uniref:Spermidine synthase n=1 Tax=Solimonas fluminis TaxID=2086571 RepID=A0A2S5TAG8_9GAMM|nr:spermidine synthase [Solimonas fluminis]PPE72001.1 spermidine synthase [Solimonas fluminis]